MEDGCGHPGQLRGRRTRWGRGFCEQAKFTANICSGYLYKMTDSPPAKVYRRLSLENKARIIAWMNEGVSSATIGGRFGRHWWSNYCLLARAATMKNLAVLE